MDPVTGGLMPTFWSAPVDPNQPWHRPASLKDRRWSPKRGGGRRMRHPFLEPIVYLQVPDRTMNFGFDRIRRTSSVLTRTLSSTAVAKYVDQDSDVVITEVWASNGLSTFTQMFHAFHTYLRNPPPLGRFIGWQPRDKSPKNYFIELLDVRIGNADDFNVEELGGSRPVLMREQLTVQFKLVNESVAPSGVVVGVGL